MDGEEEEVLGREATTGGGEVLLRVESNHGSNQPQQLPLDNASTPDSDADGETSTA